MSYLHDKNWHAAMCKLTQPYFKAILLVLTQYIQLLLAKNVQCDKPRGFRLLFAGKSLLKYVLSLRLAC